MTPNKRIKILFVDDSISIRLAAEKIFRNLGYENVFMADDGDTALERLKIEPFDLVVADWNMKKMSGMELLKEMKEDESLKEIPFLLATGDSNREKHRQAIKAGASHVMTKPFDAKVLEKRIAWIFKR
ncbi:MAG: response regulator [Proteobacteria bacterium]|nr:response regulator [Pseudomonadota bacterium]